MESNGENRSKQTTRPDNRTSNWLMVVHIAMVGIACLVLLRILYLQFVWKPGDTWERIFGIPTRTVKETPERGDILTYDGKVLATSIPLYQIRMDCKVRKDYFKDLDNPAKAKEKAELGRGAKAEQAWRDSARVLAGQLATLFPKQSADEFYRFIIDNRDADKGGRDVKIGDVIDQPTLLKVKKFALFNQGKYKGGMKIDTLDTRQYPYGALSYRAIGQVRNNVEIKNSDIGIEGKFNYALHGEDGTSHLIITDGQNFVQDDRRRNIPAVRGLDVRTTLNIEFCSIADRTLRRYLEAEADIMQGCVMIMDVKTGAIRAMVNLRKDGNGNIGESWNSCIGEANHPGSVFKTVTMLMGMDDKGMTINSPIPAKSVITYHGVPLSDKHLNTSYFPTGYATLEEGLMISSNNVFRQVAINSYGDHPENFVAKLYEYKLMEKFDFDIDGLATPTCKNPKDKMSEKNTTGWSPLDLPQMAFGYALRVTPLHILAFYNAIANKGRMMKPYLVEDLERNGVVVEKRGSEVLNASICRESTAEEIGKAMLSVTTKIKTDHVYGTGYWAFRDCKIKVAGKTGTAFLPFKQTIGGKTVFSDTGPNGERVINATFAGFFPYGNPEYTAVVSFKTRPTNNLHLEGARCGRILKDIINEMYNYCPEWQEALPVAGELPDLTAQNTDR